VVHKAKVINKITFVSFGMIYPTVLKINDTSRLCVLALKLNLFIVKKKKQTKLHISPFRQFYGERFRFILDFDLVISVSFCTCSRQFLYMADGLHMWIDTWTR
jgi:hypothetical protein